MDDEACVPFPVPDTPETQVPDRDTPAASSTGTPGLDVTGASISSVTGEDGKYRCQLTSADYFIVPSFMHEYQLC